MKNPSQQNMGRAKLTGITLNIQYPNGTTEAVDLDPTKMTCLFWSDDTVLKIFAPFYDKTQSEITKEELIKRFGDQARTIIGDNSKIKVTRDTIEALWNLPNSKNSLPAVLGKTTDCTPG